MPSSGIDPHSPTAAQAKVQAQAAKVEAQAQAIRAAKVEAQTLLALQARIRAQAQAAAQSTQARAAALQANAAAGQVVRVGSGGKRTHCASYIQVRLAEAHNQRGGRGSIHVHCPYYGRHTDAACPPGFLRTLYVSQRLNDGTERFVFAMYNYEFPREVCRDERNNGRVYLAYLDGTTHYQRNEGKHSLNFNIINAYLEFCSAIGYHSAHIWAAPPRPDADNYYIFRGSTGTRRTPEGLAAYYHKVCSTFGWPWVVGPPAGRLPKFPGDSVKETRATAQRNATQILVVDLTVHPEHAAYSDATTFTLAPSDRWFVLQHADFSSPSQNARSTAQLLELWSKNRMPPPPSVVAGPGLRGADAVWTRQRIYRAAGRGGGGSGGSGGG